MIDLTKKPFFLDKDAIEWVENTLSKMTLEEKIGQLFCPIGMFPDKDYLQDKILDKHVGGILFRNGYGAEMQETHNFLQKNSKIPLLIAANLEAGGDGIASDGTAYGKQMEVAATNDAEFAYKLGKVSCEEGAAVGCNWAFAPVVDIDNNFRNPITNVRTYGNDAEKVLTYAKEYLRAARECGVATAVKHFPGDGVDERDQHLLTSVNSLSCEEWDRTYGHIYQGMIDAGTLTVMVGHIAMPAYQKHFDMDHVEGTLPATLSKSLLKGLLREQLGFNGLIITDATPMTGFSSAMDRRRAVPQTIANGCDMFLFNLDLQEDYQFMLDGYKNGIITEKRLKEAVTRILATKAALGLHKSVLEHGEEELKVLRAEKHVKWATECADQAITLVKDTQKLLPVSPMKHKRVLLELLGKFPSNERVKKTLHQELEAEGFEVIDYVPEDFGMPIDNVAIFKAKYDLVLYVGNIENASNQTTARIQWHTYFGAGNNIPWFVHEVPTLFISLANPYHLLDVPMIKTYINCYSNNDYVLQQVVKKILGKSSFKGISPIDPFCGREDTKY